MKSAIKTKDGGTIFIEARHTLKTIVITQGAQQIHLPADLSRVFSQAVDLAGRAIEQGPARSIPTDIGIRCHGDACCAGQLECPTPRACGIAC
ncbi:MAG: hypothetical protein WB542_18150 [Polaromonas sp.]